MKKINKTKKVTIPVESKENFPREWYEACERTLGVLQTSFSRSEFLRFTLDTYRGFPFLEFGDFFDMWIKQQVQKKLVIETPPLLYDQTTYSKANLIAQKQN